MSNFKDSHLWRIAFSPADDTESERYAREKLRLSYLEMRTRVKTLVAQIPQDLREFTVHDVTHLDSLWHLASLIAGDDICLNPIEGFIFGAAVLTHDAGMSLAAYPGGIDELRTNPRWQDSIYVANKQHLGRAPTSSETDRPSTIIEKSAVEYLLRELHAEQAEKLGGLKWQLHNSEPYYLIDNPDLRSSLAAIIGKIAFSHWWPVSRLRDEFPKRIGAPLDFPPKWQTDPKKIACLLRLGDAAHLDWKRAPGFLRVLLRPGIGASDHWMFQERLNQPLRDGDRLVFTSSQPFERTDANAWWLCLRVIRALEAELRGVDDLLADESEQRFAAKTVKGAEEAGRFAQLVPTRGWVPVEAKIQVTDVAALVKKLGGEELYGDDLSVPVRELIQNASDAIRARRFLSFQQKHKGQITVRLGKDSNSEWLEVEDNGIGMSKEVLTGPFLDFGKSYWGSALMMSEHPGLASSGFESTGKYGIGFFATFMLGDRVTVLTRGYNESSHKTHVLEFQAGIREQPLLRRAEKDEELADGGTRIRIYLSKPAKSENGLLHRKSELPRFRATDMWDLSNLVLWLCPAMDSNIIVEDINKKPKRVVAADDWLTMPGAKLLGRLELVTSKKWESVEANLHYLRNPDGQIVGRACIVPYHYRGSYDLQKGEGVITVGGLRSSELVGIAGILKGVSKRAARDEAEILVNSAELARWANEQVNLVKRVFTHPGDQAFCAVAIELCGGCAESLPIVRWNGEWLSCNDLAACKNMPMQITLIGEYDLKRAEEEFSEFKLAKNVFITSVNHVAQSIYAHEAESRRFSFDAHERNPLEKLITKGLAGCWGVKHVKMWWGDGAKIGEENYGEEVRIRGTGFVHPDIDEESEEF